MFVIEALVGAGLLIFGRKLFWFFVAGVGFVTGLSLATSLLKASPAWLILLVALGAGLVGALLAVFLERFAIGLVGFISGGYILTSLMNMLNAHLGLPFWIFYLIGGILGAGIIFAFLDWMLIILSSLAGASMVAEAFRLHALTGAFAYIVLLVAGILIQGNLLRQETRHAQR
jgi:hypothetical protein